MIIRPWEDGSKKLVDSWTLFSKNSRIVRLFNPIISSAQVTSVSGGVPSVAETVFADLILLSQEGNDPVKIVINSPGGSVQAGFTIIKAMQHLNAKNIEVWTFNICNAASMAGVILAMGTPGHRYVLSDAMTHSHEIQIKGLEGRSSDVEEAQEFTKHQRDVLERLCAERTKIPEYYKKLMDESPDENKMSDLKYRTRLVREFMKQERILTDEKAKEAGMVDHIVMPGDSILDEIFRRVEPAKETK